MSTHRRSSSAPSLTLSLDPNGHVREPLCSWAPPSVCPTFPAHEQHQPLFGPTTISTSEVCLVCLDDEHYHDHDHGACNDPSHGPTRPPIIENFPPLFPLPDRSTHNYEVECMNSSGMNLINSTPRSFRGGAETNAGSSGGGAPAAQAAAGVPQNVSGPRYMQRRNTLEDQRRIQHMRIIYGSDSDPARQD